MRKQKNNKQKLILIAGLIMTLILGYRGYQAGWFENNRTDNLGAVAAVSSTNGKLIPGAKAVSGSTSSPQPVIAVTSYPTFEMKYGSAGNENNLVVKAEYSVTAQNGKIFLPINWNLMEVKNTLYQYAYTNKIETRALDSVVTGTCATFGSCYEIPKDKTVRFVTRQVYDPKIMFGGAYTAKLNSLYFSLDARDYTSFYYKLFPSQTSKLNTITVVGEKSPYVYTATQNIPWHQTFTLKGIRLSGTKPVITNSIHNTEVNPIIISQSDTSVTLNMASSFGPYSIYFVHPVYGKSNTVVVNVESSSLTPEVVGMGGTIVSGQISPSKPHSLTGEVVIQIKAKGGTVMKPTINDFKVVFTPTTDATAPYDNFYTPENSIEISPVDKSIEITPNIASIKAGEAYTVKVKGVIYSNNPAVTSSQMLRMVVPNVISQVDGQEFYSFPLFNRTPFQRLVKVVTP
ncbi:MAG: hypothetical protein KBC48_01870 [Candidatus Pacebacteria bacterium]|nr:hypothetical protein [Candidatus Paceibacterota bacterium]